MKHTYLPLACSVAEDKLTAVNRDPEKIKEYSHEILWAKQPEVAGTQPECFLTRYQSSSHATFLLDIASCLCFCLSIDDPLYRALKKPVAAIQCQPDDSYREDINYIMEKIHSSRDDKVPGSRLVYMNDQMIETFCDVNPKTLELVGGNLFGVFSALKGMLASDASASR